MSIQSVVGIGIAGFGGFGKFLKQSWEVMPEVQITAVCDEDPSRRPEPTGANAPTFYQRYDDMLADSSVTIVCIATPPASHKDMALQAIAAGKHVLVEKPFALTAAEGREIAAAAKSAGKVVTVDFMLRYDPIVEILKKIIDTQVFGKLRRVDLRNYAQQEGVPEGHWFWDRSISGGILVEHGVHFFDLAHYLNASEPKYVTGLAVERKPGMEDRVFAAVTYENRVVGTFWHSFSRPLPLERTSMHFAFDLGEITVQGWVPLEMEFWGWTSTSGLRTLQGLVAGSDMRVCNRENKKVMSSEFTYDFDAEISGKYALPQPKSEVYAACLRDIMREVVYATADPDFALRVTAEDGIRAVEVAEKAAAAAQLSLS